MRILGVNAVFHDPAAALVIDGRVVAAAEEERFSRRKHGKPAVPFATWELPVAAIRWCLDHAGVRAEDIDAVGYSYDPALMYEEPLDPAGLDRDWEHLRTLYAERAPGFLKTALPGLNPAVVHHVRHHVAHTASTALASPHPETAVLVVDGRGERASMLAGVYREHKLDVLAVQQLPHSLGLLYESLTEHLGFTRSSDEYKVMAMASYGRPRFADRLRGRVYARGDGGFCTEPIDWEQLAPPGARRPGLQRAARRRGRVARAGRLAARPHRRRRAVPGRRGGAELRCQHPHSRRGRFRPGVGAAGRRRRGHRARRADRTDARRAAGPRLVRRGGQGRTRRRGGELRTPARSSVGRRRRAGREPVDRLVPGPRRVRAARTRRHPRYPANAERLNAVKGREQFRPVAPMVLAERAAEIFSRGPLPSPYMLFVHDVGEHWRSRIPAVTHVDGTARIQTVDADADPLLHATINRFAQHTGVPVVVNTSFNTAGRPMVDTPRDALEVFGSSPIDVLAVGPYLVRRYL